MPASCHPLFHPEVTSLLISITKPIVAFHFSGIMQYVLIGAWLLSNLVLMTDSSMCLHVSAVHSFRQLSSIPLCQCTKIYPKLMDFGVVPSLGLFHSLLWMTPPWVFLHKSLCGSVFSQHCLSPSVDTNTVLPSLTYMDRNITLGF